tara:strand:+ start:449 stop:865 length:417 start_codon:yes stop_codon:yes gene_type:complete
MNTYDYIKDPATGNLINIHTEHGKDILQQYSNISGRTKINNTDFFKFREHEYNVLTTKVRPFLKKVLSKHELDTYINSHLDYTMENSLLEVNMANYIAVWNNFMYIISNLIKEYKKNKTPTNTIKLDISTNKLKIKKN